MEVSRITIVDHAGVRIYISSQIRVTDVNAGVGYCNNDVGVAGGYTPCVGGMDISALGGGLAVYTEAEVQQRPLLKESRIIWYHQARCHHVVRLRGLHVLV